MLPSANFPSVSKSQSIIWIDQIKGLSILGIFFNHVIERLLDAPSIGFPTNTWGTLESRIAQIQPLDLGGWTIVVNCLRYLGWMGNYGVALFLIASGFGLTWGLLQRQSIDQPIDGFSFVKKRLLRIYPMWWVMHLGFIVTWLITGWGLSVTNWRTWVSLSGWRVLPSTPFYFVSAWWFVPLILQLYLLYPLLWKMVQKFGVQKFLVTCCLLGFSARALGFYFMPDRSITWSMGILGVCRLPEFAFGIALALYFYHAPIATDRFLRKMLPIAIPILIGSTAWGLTWTGAVFFQFLTGVSLLTLLYALIPRAIDVNSILGQSLAWFGKHSYSLFLIHAPVLFGLLPTSGWAEDYWHHAGLVGIAFMLSIFSSLLLEKLTRWSLMLLPTRLR